MRTFLYPIALLAAPLLVLSGCGSAPPAKPPTPVAAPALTTLQRYHVPDFARMPYAPFSRADAVGIAMAEWRAFGQRVNDDPPHSHPPLTADQMPDRLPGMWERVGVYWWMGQNADRPEASWTSMHDADGSEFSAERDDDYAWSAAFISYVMRTAGAGDGFPYAASHYVYINAAARQALGREQGWVVTARRPKDYAPVLGDLICTGRDAASGMKFDRLPARPFPAHCDIIVTVAPGQLSVVGGNVDNAVTMKHVPVGPDGKLTDNHGKLIDQRFDWFVVLQVAYAR